MKNQIDHCAGKRGAIRSSTFIRNFCASQVFTPWVTDAQENSWRVGRVSSAVVTEYRDMAEIKSIMQTLAFVFVAIGAAEANECDQSVVKLEVTAQSDAYVDLSSTKNFGKANGLFLQNEGRAVFARMLVTDNPCAALILIGVALIDPIDIL